MEYIISIILLAVIVFIAQTEVYSDNTVGEYKFKNVLNISWKVWKCHRRWSEAVNRRTENTMYKRTNNDLQTATQITKDWENRCVSSYVPEGYAVPVALEALSCYSCYKPHEKSWVRDCYYDQRTKCVVICDTDIP